MSKTVRVKVTSSDSIRTMSENAAIRLAGGIIDGKQVPGIDPKEYRILEPPKVEVMNLPPLSPVDTQKKSVVVADEKPNK